jgi:hypothetical protein
MDSRMNAVAKGYDFTLTRTLRLLSLIAEWWGPFIILCILLIGAIPAAVRHPVATGVFGLLLLFFLRGLVFGVVNLFYDGRSHVEIHDRGVGFGRDSADWWIFTDGIRQIRRNRWGTTSIRHHNGTYIDIPTALISPADFQKLEAGMKKYRDYWTSKKTLKGAQPDGASNRHHAGQ